MKKTAPAFWLPPLLFFLAPLAFILLYLQQERAFVFWDYAMYANMAQNWASLPGLSALWGRFIESFGENYNLLFAAPSLLTFSLFEPSRPVFISTNYLFFGASQIVAFSFLLRLVFSLGLRKAVYWAFGLSFFLPFFWQPLLEGYPDHGGGAFMAFALFFSLRSNRSWREAVFIGALTGLAIVFRRPFVYSALSLFLSMALWDALILWREKNVSRFAKTHRLLGFYALVGSTALLVLLLFEASYVRVMLATDFSALYRSYNRGCLYFLTYFTSRLGLFLGFSVLAGFYLAFRRLPQARSFLMQTGLFLVVWLAVWSFGPAQADAHYLLAAPPVFCVLGLAGLLLCSKKLWIKAAFLSLLSFNSLYALWLADAAPLPSEPPTVSLLSAPRPPLVRADYDSVIDLARYVEQISRDSDHIAVASSSFILNQDMFREIYLDLLRRPTALSRFIPVSEIDGVQPPSFDAYVGANIYIVPEPAQYHLEERGQTVLTALSAMFPPPLPVFSYFEREARSFDLENGVKAYIWRRKEWTPGALHDGLSLMRKIADDPARLWFAEKRGTDFLSAAVRGGFTDLIFRFKAGQSMASVFFDRPLPPGLYRLGMQVSNQYVCMNPLLTLRLRNRAGETPFSLTKAPMESDSLLYLPFAIPSGITEPIFLSLDLRVNPLGPCRVDLLRVGVEKIAARGLPTPIETH